MLVGFSAEGLLEEDMVDDGRCGRKPASPPDFVDGPARPSNLLLISEVLARGSQESSNVPRKTASEYVASYTTLPLPLLPPRSLVEVLLARLNGTLEVLGDCRVRLLHVLVVVRDVLDLVVPLALGLEVLHVSDLAWVAPVGSDSSSATKRTSKERWHQHHPPSSLRNCHLKRANAEGKRSLSPVPIDLLVVLTLEQRVRLPRPANLGVYPCELDGDDKLLVRLVGRGQQVVAQSVVERSVVVRSELLVRVVYGATVGAGSELGLGRAGDGVPEHVRADGEDADGPEEGGVEC
jgi:hypothetical protein